MKLCLVGAITSRPDTYKAEFADAAKAWEAEGHEIINPAASGFEIWEKTWSEFIRMDLINMLASDVDGLVALPTWRESRGARLAEVYIANMVGMPIYDSRTPGRPELVWLG